MSEERVFLGNAKGIHAAHGSVREGLAALQNFETLLRSPRIGSRSLEQIVDELRSSCTPIGDAFSELIGDLADRQTHVDLVQDLAELAEINMLQLNTALARAASGDLVAKTRLALEADVHRVSVELGTLRGLIDLLDAATRGTVTEVELGEIVRCSLDELTPTPDARERIVLVCLCVSDVPSTIVAAPRVIMQLVALALGVAARSGCRYLELAVTADRCGNAHIRVLPALDMPSSVPCVVPTIIRPSVQVARRAASCIGATFRHDPATDLCEIVLRLANSRLGETSAAD